MSETRESVSHSVQNGHARCLLCGEQNPWSLRLQFQNGDAGSVTTRFESNLGLQGYDSILHGGVIAALLDAAMTRCLFLYEIQALARGMQKEHVEEATMRVAIPISDDGVARVFDTATRLLIVDVTGDSGCERVEVPTFVRPPIYRARELASLGVDILLCEGVSHDLAERIREQGIGIEPPASANVDDAISAILRHRPRRASRTAHAA